MQKVMYRVELVRESGKLYDFDTTIKSSAAAVEVIRKIFDIEKWHNEKIIMLCLDSRNTVIGVHQVTEGTVNEAAVYTREIAVRALLNNAVNVIMFHNHPSGSTRPSAGDISSTKAVKAALEILKISLLDHFIITIDGYTSLAEEGLV